MNQPTFIKLTLVLLILLFSSSLSAMPPLHPEQTHIVYNGSPERPYGIGKTVLNPNVNYTPTPGVGVGNSGVSKMGDISVIAIMVDFSDKVMDSGSAAVWQTHLANFYTYYYNMSRNTLRITPTLTSQVYRMPKTQAYYGQDGADQAIELISDAVNAAAGEVNYADFDCVIIIHAGQGDESLTGNTDAIYSAYWWDQATPFVSLTQNSTLVEIYGASIMPESEDGASPFGTLCHEFGHQLSMDDFYDARGTYIGSCGEWALMGFGGWGHGQDPTSLQGEVPAPVMAWNVIDMGWQIPDVITTNKFGSSKFTASGYDALNYQKIWKNGVPGAEYYLIEVRALVDGFGFSPVINRTDTMQEGILVWRINEAMDDNHRDYSAGRLVELVQADGYGQLNGLVPAVEGTGPTDKNFGDGGDIFPGTTNKTEFSIDTIPSSKSKAGDDTWVVLQDIALTGTGNSYSLSFEIYIKPLMINFSGNGQSGVINTPLAQPLVALVADGKGNPVQGVTVNFAVSSGSGTLSAASAVSDIGGQASVTLTPTAVGAIIVAATSTEAESGDGNPSLNFNATGTNAGSSVDATNSLLSVNKNSASADGVDVIQVMVEVKDGASNAVEGVTVTINLTGSGNSIDPISAMANEQGQAFFNIKSTTAESKNLTATADGVQLTGQETLTFTAQTGDPIDPAASTIVASPTTLIAGVDGQSSEVTVTVIGESGNPISDSTVTLNASGSGTTITPGSTATTNVSGKAIFYVSSTIAEIKTLTAVADTINIQQQAYVTWTMPTIVSPSNSTVVISPSTLPADGTSTATITVTIKDTDNQTMAQVGVTAMSSGSGNVISEGVTNSSGVATLTMQSTVAETKTLTIKATDVILDTTPSVTFEATTIDVSAANSQVTVTPTTVDADGSTSAQISVSVKSSTNAAVSGVTVSIDATGTNSISPSTVTTGSDGIALFTIVSSESGSKTISASAGGISITDTATIIFNAVARIVDGTSSTIEITGSPAVADGTALINFLVTVKDTTGAIYEGITVTPTISGTGNVLSATSATSDSGGVAAFTLKSTVAEVKTITIDAGGVTLTSTPTATFTEPPRTVSASNSTVVASPVTVSADGIENATIEVVVKDQFNAPLSGTTVQLLVSGSNNSILPTSQVSGADGTLYFTLASTSAEAKTISVNAGGIILNSRPVVTFVEEGISAIKSTVIAFPTSGITADGISYTQLTITVKNMSDQYVSGVTPMVSISGTDNTIDPTQITATNSNGETTFLLRSTKAEAKTITVTVSGVQLQNQPTAAFVAGTAKNMAIVSSTNNQYGTVGEALPSNLKVKITDLYSNAVAGATVQFTSIASPTGATGTTIDASVSTDINGIAAANVVLGSRSGSYGFQSSVTGLTGSPVAFTATANAGPATTMTIKADSNNQSVAVFKTLPLPLAVTITDAHGNPKPGITVPFSITSFPAGATSPSLSPANAVTDSNGEARSLFTLSNLTGTYTAQATLTGLTGSPVSFTATATAGSAYRMQLVSGNDQTGVVNTTLPTPLVLQVTDTGNNPVPGVPINIHVSSGGATLTGSSPYVTDNNGKVSTAITLGTAAGVSYLNINAQVQVGSSISAQATATAGSASKLSLISGNSQTTTAGGNIFSPLIASVTDAYNNPLSNHPVTFSFSSVPAGAAGYLLGTTNAVTSESGLASTTVTLGTLKGTYLVQATSVGLTGSPLTFNLTATADIADPTQSNFVLTTPSPLTADGLTNVTVTLQAKDKHGNKISSLSADNIQIFSNRIGDRLTQPVTATDVDGKTTATISSTTSGELTLGAVIQGVTLNQSTTITFTPGPPDLAATSLDASPQGNIEIIKGNVLITIQLYDKYYNKISNFDATRVVLTATGNDNTLTQPIGLSTTDGKVYGSMKSNEAGFKVLTASIDGQPVTNQLTLLFVTKPIDTNLSTFSLQSGSNVVANGSDSYTMLLKVRDVDGNPIEGVPISAIEVISTTESTVAGVARTVTNASGETLVDVRSTSAGTVTIYAKVSGVQLSQAAVLVFVPGVAHSITAVGVTQVTGQTMTQLSNALQVQIKDPHGNPVSGTNVTYTIAQQPAGSTGAELTAASVASDTSGIASNWFKPGSKIGTSYITASVSGLVGSPITFQCTITPSALDRFVLHLAQTTTDTGNSWGGVTLMAYDAYNNLKTDYRGSVWFTATDPLAIMPWTQESRYGFVTADNGSHVFENFVFLTAGSGTITVTDGTISATSVQITVTDNIASDGTIQVVSFTMPGDAYSIFALARPSVGLERPPQMIYQSSSGIQLDLQTSSMANNTYLGIGRLSGASPVGGKVHVIGVKAGTLNYITGEDVVAK